MDKQAIQEQALSNARNGQSFANYGTIIQGFMDKGIPADDIQPRVNVFTFHAWKALGRQVRKGEHGVKVCTYIPMDKVVEKDGERKVESWKAPRMTTVFHVSQTDAIDVAVSEFAQRRHAPSMAQIETSIKAHTPTVDYSEQFTPIA